MNISEDQYKIFKQVLHTFYHKEPESMNNAQSKVNNLTIEPQMIYDTFKKTLKAEFKIGNNQLYKIKSLPEFFERMLNNDEYKYGSKLEFMHNKDAFRKEDQELLNFILKYAEIIKYSNETVGSYGKYMRTMSNEYITISNTGLDEIFDVLQGKSVSFIRDTLEGKISFENSNPEIKFIVKQEKNGDYVLTPNIDIFEYEILKGSSYTYMLTKKSLNRFDTEFKETTLKLLNIFRENYTSEIKFKREELPKFCSLVYPKLKKHISLEKIDKALINKYVPQELFIKIYLDYDKNNYITTDIKFIYGDIEFNPLKEEKVLVARDIAKENEYLDIFVNTGFMLDKENSRLILANEDKIYNFLSHEIENYMQKFEVLVTDNFKHREIRKPKPIGVGVKIKNNLLKIDLSKMDFDIEELKNIMQKYTLRKKYYRLKDGSFLDLEENDTMEFISSLLKDEEIQYNELQKGELELPISRSMYLDKILEKLDTNISKSDEYVKLVNQISNKKIEDKMEIPKNLNADLRNYQVLGFKWLKTLDNYKFGGILADDMGLGKTLQLLAVIQSYLEKEEKTKPSMVVCPSSLSLNWKNEINKFTPNIKTLVIHGSAEERKKQIEEIENYNLIITSYDLLKRDIEEYKKKNYSFKYIIADEAQYIKNNSTQNAKAIKEIKSETRFALTGTPIENSLSELWSIFDFIMPGYLYSYKKFKELYEMPIIKENDESSIKKLKMLIEPFILRRTKKEVLTELPDKTISILNNEMQDEQLKIYMSYLANSKKEVSEEIKANGFEKSQIKILALLMRLRQICCHPSLFISNYKGESSKLNQCIELLKDAIASGHKILLFSGYSSMLEIIEKELKKENIEYFKLTGSTKVGDRIKLVDEFNNNENVKVFLISLKAGGTGLNLIGADVVIHYDPWWNLSAENQATDRTYRIGQKKNVQVYKLITKDSIEERIYELQEKKSNLAKAMLSTKATFVNKLTKDDIIKLFD